MMVALPAQHELASRAGPISLSELAGESLILYPSSPRPSYADQVLAVFRDHGSEPKVAHEVRELQIAIGLVAAEEGLAIVPESVQRARSHDIIYRDLVERATTPIIMSHRVGDRSPGVALMAHVIASKYKDWGYDVPAALLQEF